MIGKFVSMFMGLLFFQAPLLNFSPDEVVEYDKIYSDAISKNTEIIYSSSYPKYRFIQYISSTKSVILHGSNNKEILEFETRRQTFYNGQYVEAVFGTKNGIWSLFYAVFDRQKLVNNYRNACLKVRKYKKNYYFFSLTRQTMNKNPWTKGTVYFLPQETFESTNSSIVSFDEWISRTPVTPITNITVEPQDFYFVDKVSCHKANESIFISWFLYKLRIKVKLIFRS
ncbi:hypothetical protein EHS13_02575 [Paenibacillus psychroresistens]|uniref:Uncharacterized protein n=1 Tax=Paenibacillus psychroresistens TaxID=1778678 RepID=A0A6B8REK7_9BACL|nr:hypothetical protein [Paenibacillus psychroresistens]QGQ93868.1 hypothetical protein EHS13_02575 [Paenibacillus psychroresistens]